MYVCMYVYIYVYIFIFLYMYIYVYTDIRLVLSVLAVQACTRTCSTSCSSTKTACCSLYHSVYSVYLLCRHLQGLPQHPAALQRQPPRHHLGQGEGLETLPPTPRYMYIGRSGRCRVRHPDLPSQFSIFLPEQ